MLPGKCLKITPSVIESEGIFSNLSTFDVPVDTGTQNFLKCNICMPIHAGYIAENIILYSGKVWRKGKFGELTRFEHLAKESLEN